MPTEQVTFDPTDEATGSQYTVDRPSDGIEIMEHAYPPAERERQYVGSADTEGELLAAAKYKNATIDLAVRLFGSSMRARATELQQKIGKFHREGGTYRRTLKDTSTVTFDVLDASMTEFPSDWAFLHQDSVTVKMQFERKPLGRLAPYSIGPFSETTNPELQFLVEDVPGDADALAELTVTEAQGADQQWIVWGRQTRRYDASANAALAYSAASRTLLGSSALATNAAMFGGSNNVVRHTDLVDAWQAILSTQASGGGSHLGHLGAFRAFARVFCPTGNSGSVSLRLAYSQGDFRRYRANPAVTFEANRREGQPVIVDLGLVTLEPTGQGTQQWQGRIEAKSTVVGDEVDVNRLWLVPTEGYGEVSGRGEGTPAAPTSYAGYDDFNQATGDLSGKNADVGGAWSSSGDSGGTVGQDFIVLATGAPVGLEPHYLRRTNGTTASTLGKFTVLGGNVTSTVVQANLALALVGLDTAGVVARYVNTGLWVGAVINGAGQLWLVKNGAGISTPRLVTPPRGMYMTVQLAVYANGEWEIRAGRPGGRLALIDRGWDADLATGGTLASGKVGLWDWGGPDFGSRYFDKFRAWAPATDAAIFANRGLKVRHDRVLRADSANTLWTRPTKYEGGYLTIPPAGREGRKTRVFVKGSRGNPSSGPDLAVDDISASLTITPRTIAIPPAS